MKWLTSLILFLSLYAIEPIQFTMFTSGFNITNAIIGTNGKQSFIGALYDSTGMFENAVYIPATFADVTNGIVYATTGNRFYLGTNGCVEWWSKHNDWYTVNGTPSDSQEHWSAFGGDNNGPSYWFIQWTAGGGGFIWQHYYVGGVSDGVLGVTTGDNTASNTWHHYAAAWGNGYIYVFIDGALVGSESVGTPSGVIDEEISIGMAYNKYTTYGYKGWIANIKSFNYCKTNFEDRFGVRIIMNDQVIH